MRKKVQVEAIRSEESLGELSQTSCTNGASVVTLMPIPRQFTLMLGIRHLDKGDKFPGLWQLCVVESDGTEKVLIDATSKGSIINMVQNEIARCV